MGLSPLMTSVGGLDTLPNIKTYGVQEKWEIE